MGEKQSSMIVRLAKKLGYKSQQPDKYTDKCVRRFWSGYHKVPSDYLKEGVPVAVRGMYGSFNVIEKTEHDDIYYTDKNSDKIIHKNTRVYTYRCKHCGLIDVERNISKNEYVGYTIEEIQHKIEQEE